MCLANSTDTVYVVTEKMVDTVNQFFGQNVFAKDSVGSEVYYNAPGEIYIDLYYDTKTDDSIYLIYSSTGQIKGFLYDPMEVQYQTANVDTNPYKVIILSAAFFGFESMPILSPTEKMIEEASNLRESMGLCD